MSGPNRLPFINLFRKSQIVLSSSLLLLETNFLDNRLQIPLEVFLQLVTELHSRKSTPRS